MNKKVQTARLSVLSNTLLIIMKMAAGVLSGSVSIISEAIHSMMDLVAAVIAFFAVRVSDTAPDEMHPYGHGKFENVSGVVEALLIFIAAVWIIYEAALKIFHHGEIDNIGIGFMVMVVSGMVNYFVSRRLYKVARETDSIALEADALHLKVDVYTSLGVAAGLGLIWLTDYHILDPLIAITVAMFIMHESYVLLKTAYSPLLDVKLPDEEIAVITTSIASFCPCYIRFHQLRTRKAGHLKYVDLHLEVPPGLSVKEAHELCDGIEADIQSKIRNIEVHIHVEPR